MYKLRAKLEALASELASHDNEVLVLADDENHPELLDKVASVLVSSAEALKSVLAEVDSVIEKDLEEKVSSISEEDVEEIAALAAEFDASGDEFLQKQASVLDQVLLNLGIKKNYESVAKQAEQEEVARIKARRESLERDYKDPTEQHKKDMMAAEAVDAINKTFKQFRPLETPLSTRYCPDHAGVQAIRIADYSYQCPLDRKIYNYQEGFTTMKGNKVPGTSVQNQTTDLGDRVLEQMSFSTRESIKEENAV